MSQDTNKKSLRSFQCRDALWDLYNEMSADLDCSVDYLINEAMRQYAKSRNYTARAPGVGSVSQAAPVAPPSAAPQPAAHAAPNIPSIRPMAPSSVGQRQASPFGQTGAPYTTPYVRDASVAPPAAMPPAPNLYQTASPQSRAPYAPPAYPPVQQSGAGYLPTGAPPPLPRHSFPPGPVAHTPGRLPPLHVIFNGQKIPVTKEEFVIGRSSKTADLPIKDGNISRRHAVVVYQDGMFILKDLGSTNGVEYHGQRIDSKRIDEGDVFQLCDYQIQFTYR